MTSHPQPYDQRTRGSPQPAAAIRQLHGFLSAESGRLCTLIEENRVAKVYTDAQDRLSRGDELEWVTFRTLAASHETALIIDGRELRTDLGGRLEGELVRRTLASLTFYPDRVTFDFRLDLPNSVVIDRPYLFERHARLRGKTD